jgi:hypothetical protein
MQVNRYPNFDLSGGNLFQIAFLGLEKISSTTTSLAIL